RSLHIHSTKSRIATHKFSNAFPNNAIGDFDTFNPLPNPKRRIVIVDGKFPSDDFATHDCSVMSSEVERSRQVTLSYATGFLDSARNDVYEMSGQVSTKVNVSGFITRL